MTKSLVNGVWQIKLNQITPREELDLGKVDLTTGIREFIVAGLQGLEYITLERQLDDFTGAQSELNIAASPKSSFKADVNGAGYGFATYHRAGKIAFVLNNASLSSDVKISLLQ